MNLDILIEDRRKARESFDYTTSDLLRDYLDDHLIFIFDTVWGQEIYYLTPSYFKRKPKEMTNRRYVEYRIKREVQAEKLLEAWLYTTNQSKP